MLAVAAAVVWLVTAPFIGAFDDPANGLYIRLALLALHFGLPISIPGRR